MTIRTFIAFWACLLVAGAASALETKGRREIDVRVNYARNQTSAIEASYMIEASPQIAWAVIHDQEGMSEYVPRILYSRYISQKAAEQIIASKALSFEHVLEIVKEDPNTKERLYVLQQFNFPWPLSNRWVLMKFAEESRPTKGIFSRSYQMVAGNLKTAEGGWHVQPDDDNPNYSRVLYRNLSDPGFQIPAFIGKPASRKTTREILEAVRNRAETMARRIAN